MPSALICINCLLLFASIVAFISADTLTAEYDFEDKRIRFYDLKQAFTLVCHLKQSTKTSKTPDIDWYKKEGQSLRKVSHIESLKDRYEIDSDDDNDDDNDDNDDDDKDERKSRASRAAEDGDGVSRTYKLTIQRSKLVDAGTYVCKTDSDDHDDHDGHDGHKHDKDADKDSNKQPSKRSESSAEADDLQAEIRVFSNPHVKMLPYERAIEGESKKLSCTIDYNSEGLQGPPIVRWKVGDRFVNESTLPDSRHFVAIEDNQNNKYALQILSANLSDANTYECIVTLQIENISRTKNATTQLFVKDKYAAVWPFLGICIEVAVLLLVIFIFEKRRNKNEIVESDSEQMPEQQSYASDTAVKESPAEIRQRNK